MRLWGLLAVAVALLCVPVAAEQGGPHPFDVSLESGTTVCLFVPVVATCPVAGQYATAMVGAYAAPQAMVGTLEWSADVPSNAQLEVFLMYRASGSGEHLVQDPTTWRHGAAPLAFSWDVSERAGDELWIVAHALDHVGPAALRVGEEFRASGVVSPAPAP